MRLEDSHARIVGSGLIQPLMHSVETVFRTMLDVEPLAEQARRTMGGTTTYVVSAIVRLDGEVPSSVVMSFEEQTAMRVASILSAHPVGKVDPVVTDAIRELANMIVGSAKSRLPGVVEMSLPKIALGDILVARGPRLVLPYSTIVGNFTVEIS